jgi:hypothetical protein
MAMIPTGVPDAAVSAVVVKLAATRSVVAVFVAGEASVEAEVSAFELLPHPERVTATTAIVVSLVPRDNCVSVHAGGQSDSARCFSYLSYEAHTARYAGGLP